MVGTVGLRKSISGASDFAQAILADPDQFAEHVKLLHDATEAREATKDAEKATAEAAAAAKLNA